MSRSYRVFSAIWTFWTGGSLIIIGLAPPGLIYYASAILLMMAVPLFWIWQPPVAACLSAPFVVGLSYMIYRYPFGSFGRIWAIELVVCYIVIIAAIVYSKKRIPVLVCMLLLISTWFLLNWRFSRVIAVRRYDMQWNLDGEAPWGGRIVDYADKPLPMTENGEALVSIWRPVADGFCWNALYSNEVRDRLQRSGNGTTVVEYNSITDFGNWAGATLKSVAGVPFYEGIRPLRPGANDTGGHHWVTKEPVLGLCDD